MRYYLIKSNLAKKLGNYTAITIYPFIFSAIKPMSEELRRHEEKHIEQWKRGWWIGFLIKYLYYNLRYGYRNNPYEIEARKAERQ